MARESLFRFAPFRWLIRSLNAFPVRRGTADLAAVKEALRRLKAGNVVLVFPEGTRTRDGSIGPMHGGPAAIAARAGVPMVPMVKRFWGIVASTRRPWKATRRRSRVGSWRFPVMPTFFFMAAIWLPEMTVRT